MAGANFPVGFAANARRPSRSARELDDEITEIEAELVESDTFGDVHETARKEKELTRTYGYHADTACTNDDIKPRYHMRDFQPSFHVSTKSDKHRTLAKQKRKARRKGQRNSKR